MRVLEDRKIHGFKARPVQTVSAGIANEIRTGAGNSWTSGRSTRTGRQCPEGSTLRGDGGRCLRQSEAVCVEILDDDDDRVAPRHQVSDVHREDAIESRSNTLPGYN